MMKITTNQKGFAALEAVLIVVILAILGGTGYYVYSANKKAGDTLDSAAKGSQGSSAKASKQAKAKADESANWYLYTAPGGNYTMRLPDGWNLEQNGLEAGASLITFSNKLAITPGTKASVDAHEAQGRDVINALVITYVDSAKDTDSGYLDRTYAGTQDQTLTTKTGVKIQRYYHLQTEDSEGIGLSKGGKAYSYYIQSGTKNVICYYSIEPSQEDYHLNVEKALKTVSIH